MLLRRLVFSPFSVQRVRVRLPLRMMMRFRFPLRVVFRLMLPVGCLCNGRFLVLVLVRLWVRLWIRRMFLVRWVLFIICSLWIRIVVLVVSVCIRVRVFLLVVFLSPVVRMSFLLMTRVVILMIPRLMCGSILIWCRRLLCVWWERVLIVCVFSIRRICVVVRRILMLFVVIRSLFRRKRIRRVMRVRIMSMRRLRLI